MSLRNGHISGLRVGFGVRAQTVLPSAPDPTFTTAPSISGTANLGDTLTLNFGAVENGTITSRALLRDGVVIDSNPGSTYTLVLADVGAEMTISSTATGANTSVTATSAAVGPVTSITSDTYGALSRAQEGAGIAVTGSSIASGDASGHWQISGGRLYPSTAGDTADMNAGPYELVFNDGSQLTITIVPNSYDCSTSAEFDALMALGAATLSGKTVRVRGEGLVPSTLNSLNFTAQGAPLRIESVGNGSFAYLEIRNVDGIDFAGVKFQMTGWPRNYSELVRFKFGTMDNLRFIEGCTFRHGYGPDLVNFDTTVQLDEYERIDNVQTATTSSTAYALTWENPAMTSGWIEFFNRGSQTVYVATGGASVTATTGSTAVAAGGYVRINSLNPSTTTHFAILSASGTSEVNARTEIGLSKYLAQAMASDGGITAGSIEFRNCSFSDISNAIKSVPAGTDFIVMDCEFSRIYMDVVANGADNGCRIRILRNLFTVPFSRSGIAENLNGDAGDPHGDLFQMFDGGTYAIGDVIVAGNRTKVESLRAGVVQQGIFLTDNDFSPSYDGVWLVSNMVAGGGGRAVTVGEAPSFPVGDALVYGITAIHHNALNSTSTRVFLNVDGNSHTYLGYSIADSFGAEIDTYPESNNIALDDVVSAAAVFPNFADLASATTRAEIDAATTTAAEGVGIGSAATANAIDWNTTDEDAVILWSNVPSGAAWLDLTNQAVASTITTGLSKILNQGTGLSVVPDSGVEWRSVDTDGTTEVQAWTTSSGTINANQFIQIRKTSSGSENTSVTASITINGFTESLDIRTGRLDPTAWLVQGGTAAYFVDPSNVPTSTTRIRFSGRFYFPSTVPGSVILFEQESTGCSLELLSTGLLRATVEDGVGATMLSNATVAPAGSITADTWHEIVFDVNHTTEQVVLTIDGTDTTIPFATSGNGVFQSNREVSFLGRSSGTGTLPSGVRTAELSVSFNGTLHKTISDDATVANADAWHRGGAATQGGTP